MMEKLTVIIPFYNGATYLKRCLTSIQKQTYTQFEVVLVDDGSTDQSVSICKLYIDEDNRFKLITVAHNGVSSARNQALQMVHTEFVTFIDADDFVSPEHFENLMRPMNASMTALSACGFSYEQEDGNKLFDSVSTSRSLEMNQLLHQTFIPRGIQGILCNKVLRMDFVNGLLFQVGIKRYEDHQFLFQFILNVINQGNYKAVITDAVTYHYVRHEKSGLTNYINQSIQDDLNVYLGMKDVLLANELASNEILNDITQQCLLISTQYLRHSHDSRNRHIARNFLNEHVTIKTLFQTLRRPDLFIRLLWALSVARWTVD